VVQPVVEISRMIHSVPVWQARRVQPLSQPRLSSAADRTVTAAANT
jgi:hypothetical protein